MTSRILARYVDAGDVRSIAEAELILAAYPDTDPVLLVNQVLAHKYSGRGIPRGQLGLLHLLANVMQDFQEGEGLSRVFSALSRDCRDFRRIWKGLRMYCPACGHSEGGYLRILRRRYPSGRVYRFAACTQFYKSGCRFTESSRRYVGRKGVSVLRCLEQSEDT